MNKTTLAVGAPWPASPQATLVLGMYPAGKPRSPRLGKKYKTRATPKVAKTPRPVKAEILKELRQHIAKNPGQSLSAIRTSLGWSVSKVENYLTKLRGELGNGHFLKANLKEVAL